MRLSERDQSLTPVYARSAMDRPVSKYELPEGELSADTAYNLIHDELMLDGNARPTSMRRAADLSPRCFIPI